MRWAATLLLVHAALSAFSRGSYAADLPPGNGYVNPAPTLSSPSGWQFRVTPYAWAPSVNGDVTVRGRTVDIDMSFWDLFDSGDSKVELDFASCVDGLCGGPKRPLGHLR